MISERLKTERERLGLSQQALADLLEISLRSQQNYEKGDRMPDAAYLSAIAAAGADVLYILTGQRSQAVPEQATLSPRQRALLDNYDHTDAEGQRVIESTALFASKQAGGKGRKSA